MQKSYQCFTQLNIMSSIGHVSKEEDRDLQPFIFHHNFNDRHRSIHIISKNVMGINSISLGELMVFPGSILITVLYLAFKES